MTASPAKELDTKLTESIGLGGRVAVEQWLQSLDAVTLTTLDAHLGFVMAVRQISRAAKRHLLTSDHGWGLEDRGYRINALALGLRQISTAWRDDDVRAVLDPIRDCAKTACELLDQTQVLDQADVNAMVPRLLDALNELDGALYASVTSGALDRENGECLALHWVLGDEIRTTIEEIRGEAGDE